MYRFHTILREMSDYFRTNQLIFVMVMGGVFFEVRSECLKIISTNFSFKGLTSVVEGENLQHNAS
jgi:hypothetical protein